MLDETIYVLDTSAIIDLKRVVKAKDQWSLAKYLETMVEKGRVTFPRQVTRELAGQRHIDLPEAWTLSDLVLRKACGRSLQVVQQPLDPTHGENTRAASDPVAVLVEQLEPGCVRTAVVFPDGIGTVPQIGEGQTMGSHKALCAVEGTPVLGVDTHYGDSLVVVSSELLDFRGMIPADRSPICPEPQEKGFAAGYE